MHGGQKFLKRISTYSRKNTNVKNTIKIIYYCIESEYIYKPTSSFFENIVQNIFNNKRA